MIGIKSDVGNVRTLNEDYANYYEGDTIKLYVLADGMGGHNAGEIASRLAVETIIEFFRRDENISLKNAIEHTNIIVYKNGLKIESHKGMGTTIVACLFKDNKIELANIGDSCCIGINDFEIKKLTKDHSFVQELIDSGSITEEEAMKHPSKNIITRALGTSLEVAVDIYEIEQNKYKTFLLCSDGLTNEISQKKIFDIVNQNKSKKDFDLICDELVFSAKNQGGRDNITVVLFEEEV